LTPVAGSAAAAAAVPLSFDYLPISVVSGGMHHYVGSDALLPCGYVSPLHAGSLSGLAGGPWLVLARGAELMVRNIDRCDGVLVLRCLHTALCSACLCYIVGLASLAQTFRLFQVQFSLTLHMFAGTLLSRHAACQTDNGPSASCAFILCPLLLLLPCSFVGRLRRSVGPAAVCHHVEPHMPHSWAILPTPSMWPRQEVVVRFIAEQAAAHLKVL
jgi:hypothetical protein